MSVLIVLSYFTTYLVVKREANLLWQDISKDFVFAKEKEDGVYGIWNGFSNFIWAENIHWN